MAVQITDRYTTNDTLIIEYVSKSTHHGYYRCRASNELFNQTYEDEKIIFVEVEKSAVLIPILIACIVIGVVVLILILCSTYFRKRQTDRTRKEARSS